MGFKAGEYVTYATQGICKINGKVKREICGNEAEYYELVPVYEQSVALFVPADNPKIMAKMHRLITRKEIEELVKSMPDEENIWIESESARKEKYKNIISSGNRKELVQLIRTLYLHKESLKGTSKKLHVSDERFMKDAEKLLYEEFAFVLGISREQVVPYITGQLEK